MKMTQAYSKSEPESVFSAGPKAPKNTSGTIDEFSLSSMRDELTNGNIDPVTVQKIDSLMQRWNEDPQSTEPLSEMINLLELTRKVPRSKERIIQMNSIVRGLGRPDVLATFLDMLREIANRDGTREQEICRHKLQNVKMHSIYGWCGNTLLVESLDFATEGTYSTPAGLGERLGNSAAAWNLTVHIWQPNLSAKGFKTNAPLHDGYIVEPPHSHPFDFVSTVVKGSMYQSIYSQCNNGDNQSVLKSDRYKDIELEHVDGVWPPHEFRETCSLKTLENRVLLKQGDSYHMPCHWIHDVEIDAKLAAHKPTITLFMSSEYMVMPHVYMLKDMADFHDSHPDIKKNGAPIPQYAWHNKLKAISEYLRGETEYLDLNSIVGYTGEYAFFNVNS